jgi:hypothetical protein
LLDQCASLAQPTSLDLERLVFTRLEPRSIDLAYHVAQVVGSPANLVEPGGEPSFVGTQLVQGPVRLGDSGALTLRVSEGIEDVALGIRVEQRLGLVLAVEVH